MKRAEIIVSGEVQRVGYRDEVERIAKKLGISGYVQNVKPYDVKIVAEGKEKELKEFVKKIKIKKFPIDVEKIEVKYKKPTHEFKYLEIKRGDWKEELGERMDAGGRILYGLQEGQKTMIEKQDTMIGKQVTMIGKQDENTDVLKEFKDQTQENFSKIGQKYGNISKGMFEILKVIHEDRLLMVKAIDKTTEAIKKIGGQPSKGG